MRYKNWKIYFTMEGSSGASALMGPRTYGWAQVQNIRRDPFEQAVGEETEVGDVNGRHTCLPERPQTPTTGTCSRLQSNCGCRNWGSYIPFPPLQDPARDNLVQVLEQVKRWASGTRADNRGRQIGGLTTGGLMWPPAFAASEWRRRLLAHQGVSECAEPIVNAGAN